MSTVIEINIHPFNFIIISGILQSIILAGLLFLKKGSRYSNGFIGLFIVVCSLHFSWSLIIDTNLGDIFKPVFWFPYSYITAVGPLLFFYTKSLTKPGFKITKKDLVHFLPVALEILMQFSFIKEGIRNNTVHYSVPGFLWFRVIELIGVATSIVLYGKQCLAFINMHEAAMVQNFSNDKDITLVWLYKLIKYLRVLWIFWLLFELSFILFLKFQMHLIPVYLLLYILLGIVTYSTYWIGIQAFTKSTLLTGKNIINSAVEITNVYTRLKDSEVQGYVEAINQLMQGEKLFLHETLNLRTLSAKLKIDPNLVSFLLNNVLNKSFSDYVNEFRIEEIKSKIENPAYSHLKIVEIAYESGFNSKATFNRVFKKLTGKSPSEYKKTSL